MHKEEIMIDNAYARGQKLLCGDYSQYTPVSYTHLQMANLIYEMTGNQKILAVMDGAGLPQGEVKPGNANGEPVITNSIGQAIGGDSSAAGKARQRAATSTEVKL